MSQFRCWPFPPGGSAAGTRKSNVGRSNKRAGQSTFVDRPAVDDRLQPVVVRTGKMITDQQAAAICDEAFSQWDVTGKRVVVVVPDRTRTCPMALFFRLIYERIAGQARELKFLVALGTHAPLNEKEIYGLAGIDRDRHEHEFSKAQFFNHNWKDHSALVEIGRLPQDEISDLTGGLFSMEVGITCNRMVAESDLVIIVGPVFPHEVVGFSGGNKYLFPGTAGAEIIDFFHWLGAVITSPLIIGKKRTPVREVIDRAAGMLSVERRALCMVVQHEGLAGLFRGTPEEAWSHAADLSERLHVRHHDRPYHTVLSCAPEMYDDLWTGGKCMYKVEPVVEDGGRVIVYAPHVKEISKVHGAILRETGYHTRDFFLARWEKYKHYPWGVLAHSTHVKGAGIHENGVEKPRIEVVLATGIPEDVCRSVNLGYMDWKEIHIKDFEGREEEGVLCVHRAGEELHRLRGC